MFSPTHPPQPSSAPTPAAKTPLSVFTPTQPINVFTPTPVSNVSTSHGVPTSNPTSYTTTPTTFKPIPPPSVTGVQVFSPQVPSAPVKYSQPVTAPFTPPKPFDLLATAAPKQPVTPVNPLAVGPPPVSPYQPLKSAPLLPGTSPTTGTADVCSPFKFF